jgi:hypothetical protein
MPEAGLHRGQLTNTVSDGVDVQWSLAIAELGSSHTEILKNDDRPTDIVERSEEPLRLAEDRRQVVG